MIELLRTLATDYVFERAKPFAGSAFGNLIRHDLATEAKKRLIYLPYDYKVKASVGAGNWASVPWLGFFDPIITESATSGFYVVYLINADSEEITLSLNQGTTKVYQEYGEKKGLVVLERRAQEIRDRVHSFASKFDVQKIDLGSIDSLPRGYTAGHAFGRTYSAKDIDLDKFNADFEMMLAAYEELVNLGGTTPIEAMSEGLDTDNIVEIRRQVLSRRIERAPNVRPRVLEKRGLICEGCDLDPELHLSYRGRPEKTPLDVHHAKPLSGLEEGESRRYRIPDDFLVLCPTCHRMIHKQDDPGSLRALRKQIKFRHDLK